MLFSLANEQSHRTASPYLHFSILLLLCKDINLVKRKALPQKTLCLRAFTGPISHLAEEGALKLVCGDSSPPFHSPNARRKLCGEAFSAAGVCQPPERG